MKHNNMVIFLLIATIFFMAFLWLIDISISAITVNRMVINIYNIPMNPNFTYHLALISLIMEFYTIMIVVFFEKKENAINKPD